MNPQARARFLDHANRLVAEGRSVLGTEIIDHGHFEPGVAIFPGPPYVDHQKLSKWVAGCRNLVIQMGDAARGWASCFEQPVQNYSATAHQVMGNIEALKEAIEHDALIPVESLVFTDAFDSLLDQAGQLLDGGYLLAAGALGRAVVETHLRKLCDRHNCLPAGRPTIELLKQALVKGTHLDKLGARQVDTLGTAGNHCAHNAQPPLPKSDVEKFLKDIQDFLFRHPIH